METHTAPAMPAGKVEQIRWVDSGMAFAPSWTHRDIIQSRAETWSGHNLSVGFVVYENDYVVVLVGTWDKEVDNMANAMLIYKPAIVDRRVLE